MEVLVMKSSTDAIWASVAPVTFWRVVASFWLVDPCRVPFGDDGKGDCH